MTNIVLNPITSGYNPNKVNANFEKIEEAINNDVLNLSGGNNVMLQDIDMNNNSLLNLSTNVDDPNSLVTVAQADLRYYNVSGDTLEGPMDAANNPISNVGVPTTPGGAVRKDMLDQEATFRSNADASLQDQISGVSTPLAGAFQAISWHDQVITNSVTIPDNKNAWSFGPFIAIAPGQTVTVGDGSYWTIAEGVMI